MTDSWANYRLSRIRKRLLDGKQPSVSFTDLLWSTHPPRQIHFPLLSFRFGVDLLNAAQQLAHGFTGSACSFGDLVQQFLDFLQPLDFLRLI